MVLSSAGAASKFALLAVSAAAMVGLSACQVSGAASGGPSAAGPEVSQPAAGGKVPTDSGSDGKAPVSGGSDEGSGGVGRCGASDLSVDIADQGSIAPAGTASWLLTATNTSGRSCAIDGYPSFGLLDASGSMWSGLAHHLRPPPRSADEDRSEAGRDGFRGSEVAGLFLR
ncbi:MAG: hypothetical protein JWO67_7088 [Streptosporangiaceae bacterium]|nr:hypothetical protein [Streptosporangiaceae bacterium]